MTPTSILLNNNKIIIAIDYIGFIGPFILFFLTIILLSSLPYTLGVYVIGFILNIIANISLKLLLKQPRPDEDNRVFEILKSSNKRIPFDKYGLPSGHAQSCAFSTFFLLMTAIHNIFPIHSLVSAISPDFFYNWKYWIFLYILITINTCYQRIKYNNHTIFQVIIGLLVGCFLGCICFKIGKHFFLFNKNNNKNKNKNKNKPQSLLYFETFLNTNVNTNLI